MPKPLTTCGTHRIAAQLLNQAGFAGNFALAPLAGGANNRVIRLRLNGKYFLLKMYFRHARDPRDRLNAEYAFLRFAWNHGIHCVPRPYAVSHENRAALYEFIKGRRIRAADVSAAVVRQASMFFQRLNARRASPDAAGLPPASESCFSIEEHIHCVTRRMQRLKRMNGLGPGEHRAMEFIHTRLAPAWQSVSKDIGARLQRLPAVCSRPMRPGARRISPSDFGFHNALLTPTGKIRFIDFEYAGWDDPAKTVCDFFCQVAVPVPWSHMPDFTTALLADQSQREQKYIQAGIRLLLPLYQIKWCCILLNDFLPTDSLRRQFAQGMEYRHDRKAVQLKKAEVLLDRLVSPEAIPL